MLLVNINYKIKELRLKQGISIRKLAELSDISYAHISLIENGKRHPTLLSLIHIASALNVDVSELYEYYTEQC